MIIINTLINFIDIIQILLFIDIVSSWLIALWILKNRISFLENLFNPIYNLIKKILPTNIGFLDFTPLILIFWLILLENLFRNLSHL